MLQFLPERNNPIQTVISDVTLHPHHKKNYMISC